jgi:hypothetical protein
MGGGDDSDGCDGVVVDDDSANAGAASGAARSIDVDNGSAFSIDSAIVAVAAASAIILLGDVLSSSTCMPSSPSIASTCCVGGREEHSMAAITLSDAEAGFSSFIGSELIFVVATLLPAVVAIVPATSASASASAASFSFATSTSPSPHVMGDAGGSTIPPKTASAGAGGSSLGVFILSTAAAANYCFYYFHGPKLLMDVSLFHRTSGLSK